MFSAIYLYKYTRIIMKSLLVKITLSNVFLKRKRTASWKYTCTM